MLDSQRAHVKTHDCWCNPYVLRANEYVLVEYAGTIVRIDPIGRGQQIVHVEPTRRGTETEVTA